MTKDSSEKELKEKIKVVDKFGFHHEVMIVHVPQYGFSTAYSEPGDILGQVELGRIREPIGDDDREWESYHDRLAEWTDEIKVNLIPKCKEYFDREYQN